MITKQNALETVKAMRKGQNSVAVNGSFVVVRISRDEWRLGELCGDWLMSGTAEDVVSRAFRA